MNKNIHYISKDFQLKRKTDYFPDKRAIIKDISRKQVIYFFNELTGKPERRVIQHDYRNVVIQDKDHDTKAGRLRRKNRVEKPRVKR